MSFDLTQLAIDVHADMSVVEHSVLVVICRFADDKGECYPSTTTLKERTHAGIHAVRQAIQTLEREGWITTRQAPGAKHRYFSVNVAKLRTEQHPGTEQYPRTEKDGVGVRNSTGTPSGSVPQISQVRSQSKSHLTSADADVCPSAQPTDAPAPAEPFCLSPEEKPKRKRRAALVSLFSESGISSLPEDWRSYCAQVRPDLDPDISFAAFAAYWTSGRGKGGRKKNWTAAWQTWVRRENEMSSPRQSAAPLPRFKTREEREAEAIAFAQAELERRRRAQSLC